MNCPNPNCIPFPPELPDRAGIGYLKGPCWKCGQYGNSETGDLVRPEDVYAHNPGHDEDPEEWDAQTLKDLYTVCGDDHRRLFIPETGRNKG